MPFIPIKNTGDYLTIKDVAQAIGVNAKTLRYRIQVGRFPAPHLQPEGSLRKYYTQADVDRFLLAAGKEVK